MYQGLGKKFTDFFKRNDYKLKNVYKHQRVMTDGVSSDENDE